jgi:hypothetical protein
MELFDRSYRNDAKGVSPPMAQYSPTLSRRSLVGIAAMLAGGSALGARRVFADPPEPAHRHGAAVGTPAASGGASSSSPGSSIFDRAWDPGTGIAELPASIATFCDFDAETAALGLTKPAVGAADDEIGRWTGQMPGLAVPRDFSFLLTPEWKEYTGFEIAQVSQSVEIGDPPEVVTMYAGTFDRDTATETWTAGGYRKIEDDGEIGVYSFAEDDSFSPDVPLQRMFLARRNNAAIIGSDLVMFAPTLDLLREAIGSATGETSALGAAPGVAALLASTPALASSAIVAGSAIQSLPVNLGDSPEEIATAIAEQQAQDQMPPVLMAMIGITPGGPLPTLDVTDPDATPAPTPETATLEISLLMLTQEAAQQAIEIAGERLETAVSFQTNHPFTEIFASWDLSVAPDAPVARLSITLQNTLPNIWTKLLFARDLPFLS